ncbi:antimicrobial ginkbilobin-2-like protein [Tasmannia lanceolata]|uniref:antimicrobial ginkbilobin-2-like protein n=1 Tax=Tasmannia lanceolata TaxID=3420 RepID=UPI0040638845
MDLFKLTPLHLLYFALLIQTVVCNDPLFHFCSSSNTYTANGPYAKNLNQLLSSLSIKVPPTGFGLGSVGQGLGRVNGLSLCRGDVSSADCKTCVVDATSEIRQLCPYNEEAILWYDNCLLHYSNAEFFGQIDNKNKFYMWNTQNVSDPMSFNQKTRELIHRLSLKAYVSPLKFATGDMKLGEYQKLYGLVQCTRDLSSGACKECLETAISELPSCCDGKQGGRVVGGSCNFRYELYPFVNA